MSGEGNNETITFSVVISLCSVHDMPCSGLPGLLVHQMAATDVERYHEYQRAAYRGVHAGCVYGWRIVS